MQVAFLSEGATEAAFALGAGVDEGCPRAGAIVTLVERILDVHGVIMPWRPDLDLGPGAGPILTKGHSRLRAAARAGARAAVMLVDADGRVHDRLSTLAAQVHRVIAEKPELAIPTAIGVPVEKFEAWLLADEFALCRVLGLPNPSEPMGDPENLKGKRGEADDPKAILATYLSRDARGPRSFLTQVQVIVAEMNLDTVARRCRSFQRFCGEVRQKLGPLLGS